MESLGIILGTSSHNWADTENSHRINRADHKSRKESKEGRILRRQQQKDALDIIEDSLPLYGPGIDDSIISIY
ncbi:unnamed protein product [Trichogramma brassicae]|uniref:Uncharacterized protein n=1 Tax=Trichogramma brassicae TaxID=86971 RepID=A0A6H5IEM4_9HYME|nr:unnamed protein product [Trichogramma brassicae]